MDLVQRNKSYPGKLGDLAHIFERICLSEGCAVYSDDRGLIKYFGASLNPCRR